MPFRAYFCGWVGREARAARTSWELNLSTRRPSRTGAGRTPFRERDITVRGVIWRESAMSVTVRNSGIGYVS
jgi:hypothetical protein